MTHLLSLGFTKMIDVAELNEDILDDESSSGSTCKFIDLENGWGLKCFSNDYYDNYRRAYITQKFMAKHGEAPKVGESIIIGNYYCYVTEVITPMADYGYDNDHSVDIDRFDDEDEEYFDMCDANTRFRKLFGFDYVDSHSGNYGYLDCGKCVILDFDMCDRECKHIIHAEGEPVGLLWQEI